MELSFDLLLNSGKFMLNMSWSHYKKYILWILYIKTWNANSCLGTFPKFWPNRILIVSSHIKSVLPETPTEIANGVSLILVQIRPFGIRSSVKETPQVSNIWRTHMMEEDSTVLNDNSNDAEDTEVQMKTFMMYKIGKSVRASVALSIYVRFQLIV